VEPFRTPHAQTVTGYIIFGIAAVLAGGALAWWARSHLRLRRNRGGRRYQEALGETA